MIEQCIESFYFKMEIMHIYTANFLIQIQNGLIQIMSTIPTLVLKQILLKEGVRPKKPYF